MTADRIQQVLARERRAAAAEFTFTAVVFAFSAAFLTLAVYYVLTFFSAFLFFGIRGMLNISQTFEGVGVGPGGVTLVFMVLVGVLKRDHLVDGNFNPRHISLHSRILSQDFSQAITEVVAALILSGPRSAVIAFQSARYVFKLLRLDLNKLRVPIEIALKHRRKISQRDVGDINLDQFLDDIDWLKGVVRLFAPPAGFVLTAELRHELGNIEAFAEDQQPRARISFPEESPPMTEREWALSILELQGDSTAREIKNAYRRLAKIHHPDVRRSPEAESKMKALNRAREILDR